MRRIDFGIKKYNSFLYIFQHVLARSKDRRDFNIVAYSYGSVIAIELVRKLEPYILIGNLTLIDGSPDYMKAIKRKYLSATTENEYQNKFLIEILNIIKSSTVEKVNCIFHNSSHKIRLICTN